MIYRLTRQLSIPKVHQENKPWHYHLRKSLMLMRRGFLCLQESFITHILHRVLEIITMSCRTWSLKTLTYLGSRKDPQCKMKLTTRLRRREEQGDETWFLGLLCSLSPKMRSS